MRHLVELHGGTISVTSPGEGQGSTFTVRLPLQINQKATDIAIEPPTPPTPSSAPTPPAADPSLAGVRVLIVDDEPDIRQLFRIVLEECGAEVTDTESVRETLSIFTNNPGGYDVLISDIGLPEEDGYMLIRQIRELSPEAGGQIPAAALTAYTGETEEATAKAAGFQVHLGKPIEPDQLVSVVASLAGR